eukprot:3502135-Rhodomonas_salina.1
MKAILQEMPVNSTNQIKFGTTASQTTRLRRNTESAQLGVTSPTKDKYLAEFLGHRSMKRFASNKVKCQQLSELTNSFVLALYRALEIQAEKNQKPRSEAVWGVMNTLKRVVPGCHTIQQSQITFFQLMISWNNADLSKHLEKNSGSLHRFAAKVGMIQSLLKHAEKSSSICQPPDGGWEERALPELLLLESQIPSMKKFHAKGVFAKQKILKSEIVAVYGGA